MNVEVFENFKRSIRKGLGRFVPKLEVNEDGIVGIVREHDPHENAATAPPDDEFVDLCCLWAVEFYTSDHMDSLVSSFRRLGWAADVDPDSHSTDPVAWLHRLSRFPHGGGCMNLGVLVPQGSDLFPLFPPSHKHGVLLPAGVEYASAGIHDISPSLVSIAICFVFDEHYSARLDIALRTDRQTYTTPTLHGRRIHSPLTQKINHIGQIRTETSRLAAAWFSENLPGLFSSGLLGGALPICETHHVTQH